MTEGDGNQSPLYSTQFNAHAMHARALGVPAKEIENEPSAEGSENSQEGKSR